MAFIFYETFLIQIMIEILAQNQSDRPLLGYRQPLLSHKENKQYIVAYEEIHFKETDN
jgi:hypothetical protein